MLVSQKIRTERKYQIRMKGAELLACINQELAARGEERVPENASVEVWVPGGGDWSNTSLDINEHPVVISWTTVEVDQ